MVRIVISPNFFIDSEIDGKIMKEYDKDDLNTKILVYQDRVKGWFLDIAQSLRDNQHAGFVVLMIAISQIEGIEQFKLGRRTEFSESSTYIKKALKKILDPNLQYQNNTLYEDALDTIIRDVRHGLFHDGITRKKIFINASVAYPLIITQGREEILINPHYFYDNVKAYFEEYISQLLNPNNTELRENFEKRWDETQS